MSLWIEFNFIIFISFLIYKLAGLIFNLKGKYELERDFFKCLMVMAFFPLMIKAFPVSVPLPPVIQKVVVKEFKPTPEKISALSINLSPKIKNETSYSNKEILSFFILMGFLLWLCFLLRDVYKIRKMYKHSVLIKKYKNIKLFLCPNLKVPCSFWFPGHVVAFFPEEVLVDRNYFYHSLSHELQHHRQGDTKMIYLVELVKAVFYLNPFTHLWINIFHENRELKCDKEVLARRAYSASDYGNTLIDVLKLNSGTVLKRTWAMASLTKTKRRIKMITNFKKGSFESIKRTICVSLTMLFTWQALAGANALNSFNKLSMDEAKSLVKNMKTQIPIEVNEKVLKWLNYFMADPKGKAYMIKSLERMHNYKPFLTEKLKKANMPLELLAVPLMESGYSNTHISSAKAAGIWQFIASTARRYGLKVNSKVDERFHVGKETQAAIDYYNHLIKIKDFAGDWRLALLAYNAGESGLTRAIRRQGTRDPWAFTNLGDSEYLAKIMAGIILLKKPKGAYVMNPLLDDGRVSQSYGMRKLSKRPGRTMHLGVDIAAKVGTPILNPMSGVVSFAGFMKGYGKSVIVSNGNNIETRFHNLDEIFAQKGQKIDKDFALGTVGNSDGGTEPHLHLEMLINGKHVDPEIYF